MIWQKKITQATEELFASQDKFSDGLEFAAAIHNVIAELAGSDDVYKELKDDSTRQALNLYPRVKKSDPGTRQPSCCCFEGSCSRQHS